MECFQPAYEAAAKSSDLVERHLNTAIASSSLESFECRLRYIPIIMPDSLKGRYPARSKLRKKQRLYDCAPQLDYEVFVTGDFEDQLIEWCKGISETTPHLATLGATREQVEEFKRILEEAVPAILREHSKKSLH
jgi:hypothetical protein